MDYIGTNYTLLSTFAEPGIMLILQMDHGSQVKAQQKAGLGRSTKQGR